MELFRNLYQYREFLKTNVKKEIRGKYKGSFLGVLWSFLNPLLQVAVYAIVFPQISKQSMDNYIVYLIIGIIPWTFFTTVMNQGIVTIRVNAGIIKKVYFPREILPISVAVSGLVNFFISCLIILSACIISGMSVTWHIVLVPIIALLFFFFTLGLVLMLSAINIYIKDIEYIVQFVINMLFYGTPILYTAEIFPERYRWVLEINPLSHIINAFRDVFFYHQIPELQSFGYMFLMALLSFIIGIVVFRRLEKGFAEEV
jgi:ABC-type polysaccharide/polyol phosphate export permease